MKEDEALIGSTEAAALAHVHRQTIHYWTRKRLLPVAGFRDYKNRACQLYRPSDVLAAADIARQSPAAQLARLRWEKQPRPAESGGSDAGHDHDEPD